MSKTVTIRLDEDTYQMIRQAAEGQLRSISNFIEFATLSYLTEEAFVSDDEMSGIVADSKLVGILQTARKDVTAKRYQIVE
ncbi:MAG: CopG family transcriptional regulator [Spirochaetia bacterium]